MYAGHFAAGLALKAAEPRAPSWGILLGVGLLDVLFAIFLLFGIEHATITPGIAPGFRLDFIDWSHSFVMALVWGGIYGAFFLRRSKVAAAVCGFAVFSHFVLDFFMHPRDLAFWPYSEGHFGLGLWSLWPRGWWVFELLFIAVCLGYYLSRARRRGTFGGRAAYACLVVVLLHVVNSPWLSPTH
jgi:membrane-bound metal-dependent hydrolase YbcI (DUF457 family)